MKRMRWKLFFYKQKSVNAKSKVDAQNFGFKSIKTPPSDTELKSFEEDLRLLVKNVKFKENNKSSDIEKDMKKDLAKIKKDERLIIAADKTRNFYYVEKKNYEKIVHDNISSTYRKVSDKLFSHTYIYYSRIVVNFDDF